MDIKLYEVENKKAKKLYELGKSDWLWTFYPRKTINPFKKKKYLECALKTSKLCGDNKVKFKEIFGKQNFCYTTWYKAWVWFIDYDGLIISIGSSIRGTDYRCYNKEDFTEKELYKKISDFVDDLIEKIK